MAPAEPDPAERANMLRTEAAASLSTRRPGKGFLSCRPHSNSPLQWVLLGFLIVLGLGFYSSSGLPKPMVVTKAARLRHDDLNLQTLGRIVREMREAGQPPSSWADIKSYCGREGLAYDLKWLRRESSSGRPFQEPSPRQSPTDYAGLLLVGSALDDAGLALGLTVDGKVVKVKAR